MRTKTSAPRSFLFIHTSLKKNKINLNDTYYFELFFRHFKLKLNHSTQLDSKSEKAKQNKTTTYEMKVKKQNKQNIGP